MSEGNLAHSLETSQDENLLDDGVNEQQSPKVEGWVGKRKKEVQKTIRLQKEKKEREALEEREDFYKEKDAKEAAELSRRIKLADESQANLKGEEEFGKLHDQRELAARIEAKIKLEKIMDGLETERDMLKKKFIGNFFNKKRIGELNNLLIGREEELKGLTDNILTLQKNKSLMEREIQLDEADIEEVPRKKKKVSRKPRQKPPQIPELEREAA